MNPGMNSIAGHVQSLVAASQETREELEKFKNAFALAADKVPYIKGQ